MNKKWIVAAIVLVAGIVLIAGFLVFLPKPTSTPGLVVSVDDATFPEIKYSVESGCFVPGGEIPAPTISGDFDGDGQIDLARLTLQASGKEAFLVWLSSQGSKPVQLDENDVPGNMNISVAAKGDIIESACKRGYGDICAPDEPVEIKLAADGIWYTLCESAASVFYWNPKRRAFDRIWYSD